MDSLVNESNDDALDIDFLPDEVILEVFRYMKQNQLGQIARVCKRWNVLTRRPVLWKKVDVQLFPSRNRSPTCITKSFIDRLPSCVTSIKLDFDDCFDYIIKLDFLELCARLKEGCPHLETLILLYCEISESFFSVIDICTLFLQDVKKFVFRYCTFSEHRSTSECDGISKMEILNVWCCEREDFEPLEKPPFSRLPYLKELHLSYTIIGDSWFKDDDTFLNQLHVLNLKNTNIDSRTFSAIKNHGINIKELCFCSFYLLYHDVNFNNSAFPHLKAICLRQCNVTCEDIVSPIQSCQSLQNVYVDDDVGEPFAEHPFVVANRCKSEIVKVNPCNHGNDYKDATLF